MKVGVFITARSGSTRLSGKHFLPVKGRPIMAYLLDRIQFAFARELAREDAIVAIVTGNAEANRLFETTFAGTAVFYGDDDNIPRRHAQAAAHFGVDSIVSVDGDDIACAPDAMHAVYDGLVSKKPLVKTQGLPLGLNAWGYSTAFLKLGS